MQTGQALKINFKRFDEMDRIKEEGFKRLNFDEFMSGLTAESIALLKANGFNPANLPNPPPNAERDGDDFFEKMFSILDAFDSEGGIKDGYIQLTTLETCAPRIKEDGMVVRVNKTVATTHRKSGSYTETGWNFRIEPTDNDGSQEKALPSSPVSPIPMAPR